MTVFSGVIIAINSILMIVYMLSDDMEWALFHLILAMSMLIIAEIRDKGKK